MDEHVTDSAGEAPPQHSPAPPEDQTAQLPSTSPVSAVDTGHSTTRSDDDAVQQVVLDGHPGFVAPQLGYYYPPQPGYPQGVFVPVLVQSVAPRQLEATPVFPSADVAPATPQTLPASAFEPSTSFIVTPLPPVQRHPVAQAPAVPAVTPTAIPDASGMACPSPADAAPAPRASTIAAAIPEVAPAGAPMRPLPDETTSFATASPSYSEPDSGRPCRRCGRIINPGFKRCPYCNKSQVRWYQHPTPWVLLAIVLGLALLYHFYAPARLVAGQGMDAVRSFLSSINIM